MDSSHVQHAAVVELHVVFA